MTNNLNSIPVRKTSSGKQIETRPLYVEEWLDSLPYVDFDKTSSLLYAATLATNKETVKPSVRLELVQLYNRPYQYYLESQIRTGAQHTLASMELMRKQIRILKSIAVNLSCACKLAVDETLESKKLWRQSKPPLPAMLMSMNYLSQALIFNFLEYSPTPINVWRDLNAIYGFAESLGLENTTIYCYSDEEKKFPTSIAGAYKRIVLSSLMDPHHLPFGAIWEVYHQLESWNDYALIKPFQLINAPAGYFVVDIDKDMPPVPYIKFNTDTGSNRHRLVDTTNIGNLVHKHLELLEMDQKPDETVRLSGYYAKTILTQMEIAWSRPPKRYFPRERRTGNLCLTFGINSIYFYLNGKEFDNRECHGDDTQTEGPGAAARGNTTDALKYRTETWSLVDQGPGGFQVISKDKPAHTVRVGDLVGIKNTNADDNSSPGWSLGVIRWLMIKHDKIQKIGIQSIAADVIPVAIRAITGSPVEQQFRRAFIAGDINSSGMNSVIAEKGVFIYGRKLVMQYQGRNMNVTADLLVESALNYDHFNVVVD